MRAWIVGILLILGTAGSGFYVYRTIVSPPLTPKDVLIIWPFVNQTGDADFDDTLDEAFSLLLRQSPFLNLAAEQHVQATLRVMGRDASMPITTENGRDLCRRIGARALLGGAIARQGAAYVVTVDAEDCARGHVLVEHQAQAASKAAVLSALDTAVTAFREQLGEPLDSRRRYDAKIDQAATFSLEAMKAYSDGMKTRRTVGDFDAVPLFVRATGIDPQFALAYARLSTVYTNLNRLQEARDTALKSFELRERTNAAERLFIEARYYTVVENDPGKALDAYQRLLAIYPNDYAALANAGTLLRQRGDHQAALRYLEHSTVVSPNNPVAWTNLGITYVEMRRLNDARRAFMSALAVQDSTPVRAHLFAVAAMTNDQKLASEQVAAVAGRRDEADFLALRIQVATSRGRFEEADLLLGLWKESMEAASRAPAVPIGVMHLALNEALAGLVDRAKSRIATATEDQLLDSETAPLQGLVDALLETPAAPEALIKQADAELSSTTPYQFSAVEAYRLVARARAQAAAGDHANARKTYQQFFDLWKEADPGIPLLIAAREEFAKLGS